MSVDKSAPTERFSDRVDDYVKYRPHYSPEVVQALRQACGLSSDHLIVDVGCGTGLLAKIFLENGNRVTGVEPNANMRLAGEQFLSEFGKFSMVAGSAEETTLPDRSADFVIAGQAFHWFRPQPTRTEFARILRPDGWVVLIWHDRDLESTPFLRAYEDFLQRYATDYSTVAHNKVANYGALEEFYSPDRMQRHHSVNPATLRFRGTARPSAVVFLRSARGAARRGHAEGVARPLRSAIAENGQVTFEYHTRIYYGHLTA